MLRVLNQLLRPRERGEGEAGFTMAEVMVAMMVFAIISVGVAAGIINSLVLTQDGKARTVALQLASERLDVERQQSDIFAVNGGQITTSTPKTVGNVGYTIVETANWADASGAVNPCGLSGPTTALANKSVDVTVSWSSRSKFGKTAPVRMTALISPGSDSTDPNSAIIFIGVTDASGAGSANVAVNISVNTDNPAGATPLASQPAATTANGCSVARGVTAGSYKVSISRPGGIDSNQNASPSQTVTVTAGGSSTASFQYDTAASVTPALANNGGILPTNLGLTYRTAAGDFATTSTGPTKLFPYSDGYRVMAGAYSAIPTTAACTDPDPSAWTKSSDNKVGVPVPNAVTSPGSTVSGNAGWVDSTTKVPMPTFSADFGALIPTGTLTATPAKPLDTGDPGCSTAPPVAFTFPVAATKSTFALPYGTYTITGTWSAVGILKGDFKPTLSAANGTRVTISGNTITLDPRTANP
jgi:prepilin-type N-terminal cleavage/methylation domain-containing protein